MKFLQKYKKRYNYNNGGFIMRKWKQVTIAAVTAIAMAFPGTTMFAEETSPTVAKLIIPVDMKDGAYQGVAKVGDDTTTAFTPYDLQVNVSVSGGAITEITYAGAEDENLPYTQKAYEGIAGQVIGKQAQNMDVDLVSGATQSSQAFVDAINTAVEEQPVTGAAIVRAPKIKSVTLAKKGIKVSWTKVSGANKYILYRNGSKVKTVTKNSYIDTKARRNGKKYTYKVVAIAGTKKSKMSATKTLVYLDSTKINILINGSSGKMTFTWNANKKGNGYQVEYARNKKFKGAKKQTIIGKSGVITTVSNVTPGQTYYVRVRVYKKLGGKKYYSKWSAAKHIRIYR